MKVTTTPIEGLFEIHPVLFKDDRGYFFESFRKEALLSQGIDKDWVQENQSFSKAGTIRGLHYQNEPYAQAKLVKVISGKVLDVVVDLRKGSKTFGMVFGKVLDDQNHNMLYVPEGFAHGFSVLEDAVFSYKCSNYYNKSSEGGVIWNDPVLDIDWQVDSPIISAKDQVLPTLEKFIELTKGGL
ncbi:dTDP-4-dehydrorhamnose 3,5-epimerase [Cognataquiflexum rubidum]|uniref:dTDP-4-dehydrorhamnose 3,5-epimerase n=1 Tax=Cognataquiflexum rubidum TaxID=2922273 RepID=UPI001F129444|nr:dTDP-4-dehydrorhamnose 3,5-epimerase [Cognataquiflexum rubidum]MCH6233841.1 dTDP-4-dehydrorhamnose 3,5-epimerase [Cognataquiflexum rubidum]